MSRRSGRLLAAVLVVIAALGLLAYRAFSVWSAARNGASLRLSDDVSPGTPPPLVDDAAVLRARLDAVAAARTAAAVDPRDPRRWFALAQAAHRAGDQLTAEEALRTVLRLHPQ